MNNIKNDPIDQLFDGFFNKSISDIIGSDFVSDKPAANIVETDKTFVIQLAAPGFTKADFAIEVVDDHVVVSAKKEKKDEASDEKFMRREFDYTQFKRKFRISDKIDRSQIGAEYTMGILNITLGKREDAQDGPRTINID